MGALDPGCRRARGAMIEALLASPPRNDPDGALADHLAACRDCADHWHAVLLAARAPSLGSGYGPRLRDRTLARVAREQERASAGFWLWLTPAALVGMVAAYGLPAWALANALEALIGSPGLATVGALLIVGSLLLLLPASLAASLARCPLETREFPQLEKKGT